jgi:hypothetical protein
MDALFIRRGDSFAVAGVIEDADIALDKRRSGGRETAEGQRCDSDHH